MAQLYRNTVNVETEEVLDEGRLVVIPDLKQDTRTAINKALKAGTILAKKGNLEYVYFNKKEWEKKNKTK